MKGLTLIEVLLVVFVIGILASLAVVNYSKVRESGYDKEVKSNLILIQAAQKIYHMETSGVYYDTASYAEGPPKINAINTNLKLSIDASVQRKWNYGTNDVGCVRGSRYSGPDTRTFHIGIGQTAPVTGGC